MAERVRLIQADLLNFETDVAELLVRLGRTAEADLGPALQRLGEDLVGKAVRARADHAAGEAAGIAQEIAALLDDLGSSRADLAELVTLAGLDGPAGLAEVIAQVRLRNDLETDLARLRVEIGEAGDGRPVDALRAEVAALGPDALAAELMALETERHEA